MSRRATRCCAILVVLLALPCCSSKKSEETTSEKKPAPPPDPLTQAVRAVVKSCTVTPAGELRDCVGPAEEELQRAEKTRDFVASLGHYCGLMTNHDAKIRAVAAMRIGGLSFHQVLKNQGTQELLDCLTKVLDRSWPEPDRWQAERVVRATTFLATAQGKHEALLRYLDVQAPPSVKRVGYECLWPNGGMKVIDPLKKAAASGDPLMRRAVVLGFTYVDHLLDEAPGQVCPVLSKLALDEDAQVAGPATLQLARLCGDQRKELLTVATADVRKKTKVTLGLVNALNQVLTSTNPAPTAAQRKKATALLVQIVRLGEPKPCAKCARSKGPSPARLAALRYLRNVEPEKASRLARRYKLELKAN